MFVGYATLTQEFAFSVLTKDTSDLPKDSSTTPAFRVYSNQGLLATGTLTEKDTGVVTGATNASPIVITSVAHGLTTGMKVTTEDIGGNTAANRVSTIIVLTADTFSLTGSTGNGAYTSGGTWAVTGLYEVSITPTIGAQYASGHYYDVVVIATVDSNVVEYVYRFGVL